MAEILPSLLNDTLNLVSLARETALSRGDQVKADRLTPLADNLRDVVTDANKPKQIQKPSGILAQEDFQTLLEAAQNGNFSSSSTYSLNERNQVIKAMSAGGMTDIDIARQMGISSEEVRLIVSQGQNRTSGNTPSRINQDITHNLSNVSKSQFSDAYIGWNQADKEVNF